MRVNDDYKHFVAIVAGEHPEELMEPFNALKRLETPVTVYKIKDAETIKKRYLELYKALLKNNDLSKEEKREISENIKDIDGMDDIEFFYNITDEYEYDPQTGDAITYKNPKGKWLSYSLGHNFSIPFMLKNGKTSFQARKGLIDWEKMHLSNQDVYKAAWETVMEKRKPENEEEQLIYNNMKNRTFYFEKFGSKENYVISSTAFWGYAFVDKNGWKELDENMDQYTWMKDFYDKFIKPLPDKELITIYECRRD